MTEKIRFLALLSLLFSLIGMLQTANAATGEWFQDHEAKVRLVSSTSGTGDLEEIGLGLEFVLNPGWKIYWRSPGDAGIPPEIDWSKSKNLKTIEQKWPVPARFSSFGMDTFGYGEEIIFPLVATVKEPGQPLQLSAAINYLICADICVPGAANVSLNLTDGPSSPSEQSQRINVYESLVPQTASHQGFELQRLTSTSTGEQHELRIEVASLTAFDAPDLIVEGPEGFFYAKPKVEISEDGMTASLVQPIEIPSYLDQKFEGSVFTLTVFDEKRGFEVLYTAGEVLAGDRGIETLSSVKPEIAFDVWLYILGIALLGGFILNLMPCVLPVLSIKLMSALGHGQSSSSTIRASFFYTALGILASFLLLAVGAIALKYLGHSVGWGMQFQQPLFLLFMIAVITVFAANMMGWFEITLPNFLGGWASSAGQEGSNSAFTKNFSTGVLATLLATPCSAPFLGTALAFALTRGAIEIFVIFLFLGIGMALPYFLVMLAPSMVKLMPKPGRWMSVLKVVMGLALLATVVWLLWVLSAQIGQVGLLIAGSLVVLILGVFWLGKTQRRSMKFTASMLAVALLVMPTLFAEKPVAAASDSDWIRFDQEKIPLLLAEGKVVFVDVTADWCLTCKVNKKVVLESEEVLSVFGGSDVVTMKADWTNPDPAIAKYLASFGRYGIPFNVVYSSATPKGQPLPELLTKTAVLTAISDGRSL